MTSILKEWLKMPTSKAFPRYAQRLTVVKALNKAELAGLRRIEERGVYALCYLDGRNISWNRDVKGTVIQCYSGGLNHISEVVINIFSGN